MNPNIAKIMKKRAIIYSLLMSITISFCLSLFGTVTSGRFTMIGWLISFAASTLVSIIIGFVVPMKKITGWIHSSISKAPVAFLITGLISDIIYTPIITALMIALAIRNAPVSFLSLYPKSLLGSFLVGYICILICQALFAKLLMPPKE